MNKEEFDKKIEKMLHALRAKKPFKDTEDIDVLNPILQLPNSNINGTIKQIVSEAIDLIPDKLCSEIAIHHFLRGKTAIEISVDVNASPATIYRKISEARDSISETLWYKTRPAQKTNGEKSINADDIPPPKYILKQHFSNLTDREIEIVLLYIGVYDTGYTEERYYWASTMEIANSVNLSRHTVKDHLKNARKKMHVHKRAEMHNMVVKLLK